MRDLSIIRSGYVRAASENNDVQWCREKTPNEKKINGIITHILRFPPGARVTLTNRRLYCALFPVLLVLSSLICVAGWTDGQMAHGRLELGRLANRGVE